MIQLTATSWRQAWEELHRLYAEKPTQVTDRRFSARALSFDNILELQTNELGNLDVSLVGYTSYKLTLFDKRYIIPGMSQKILSDLLARLSDGRKLTIISYPFRSDDETHSQGPCLVNMIITVTGATSGYKVDFDVQMRIGEITRRLMVDFLKFQELIAFFIDGMAEYDVKLGRTRVYVKALYAEPISLVIAEHLFTDFSYNLDHWLHKNTQMNVARFEQGDIKFKRARRIRRQMLRLQEGGLEQHE